MMAVAASNPSATPTPRKQAFKLALHVQYASRQYASRQYAKSPICKPRANYLKPKEIRKNQDYRF
jgi:hypothetical protein